MTDVLIRRGRLGHRGQHHVKTDTQGEHHVTKEAEVGAMHL